MHFFLIFTLSLKTNFWISKYGITSCLKNISSLIKQKINILRYRVNDRADDLKTVSYKVRLGHWCQPFRYSLKKQELKNFIVVRIIQLGRYKCNFDFIDLSYIINLILNTLIVSFRLFALSITKRDVISANIICLTLWERSLRLHVD